MLVGCDNKVRISFLYVQILSRISMQIVINHGRIQCDYRVFGNLEMACQNPWVCIAIKVTESAYCANVSILTYNRRIVMLKNLWARRLIGLFVLTLSLAPNAMAEDSQQNLVILVPPTVIARTKQFLRPDENPDTFDDFSRPGNYRDLTDYLLLRRALALGGNRQPIEVRPWQAISYERMLADLRKGEITLFSNAIWREDILPTDKQLLITSPILNFGEMEAGLYMNPENPKLKKIKGQDDLQQLTAVTSRQWNPDWNALNKLNLLNLYDAVNFENMLRMVYRQRVDFMLIPFTATPDLHYEAIGIKLIPVPNVKIQLQGSRGWVVSKTNPLGTKTYTAIESGLAQLRKQGIISRAYREAGVINDQVKNWKVLNPLPIQETPSNKNK